MVTAMKHNANTSKLLRNNEGKSAQGITNPPAPRLLPLKRAADYLGLSPWAMRERIWAGDIPVVKFPGGRKIYLDVKDLDTFIEDNKARIV
jgi:hypothetical protein